MDTTPGRAWTWATAVALFGALAFARAAPARGETVTVGGATLTVPEGWKKSTEGGHTFLTPPGLPAGVLCRLVLLGGEAFDGAVSDRLATEWKAFETSGKVVADDGGAVTRAGAAEVASRAGTIDAEAGASLNVWLVLAHANGRVEKMIFLASTAEAYDEHVAAAREAIEGATFAGAPPRDAPAVAKGRGAAGAFGHMRYVVPPGWHEKRYSNGVVLAPDTPARGEEIDLTIMAAKEFAGGLPEALAATWDEACAQRGLTKTRTVDGLPYDVRAQRKSFKGWEYIRGDGVGTANDRADHFLKAFVIRINGRLERVVLRGRQYNQNLTRYSLCEDPAYVDMFERFVFGLTFDDWKDARPAAATLQGDGVVGAWHGIALIGGEFNGAYAIFFSNSQVYFGSKFPVYGCDGLDTWTAAENASGRWGTYTFDGENGLITMPRTTIPVRAVAEQLVLTTNKTDHKYVRLPPVDGAAFDGTYATAGPNNAVAAITFAPDGRFEDRGALDRVHEVLNYPFRITQAPGTGTYAVKDYTVTFMYDDGRVFRAAFPGDGYDPANPSPAKLELGVGGRVLAK